LRAHGCWAWRIGWIFHRMACNPSSVSQLQWTLRAMENDPQQIQDIHDASIDTSWLSNRPCGLLHLHAPVPGIPPFHDLAFPVDSFSLTASVSSLTLPVSSASPLHCPLSTLTSRFRHPVVALSVTLACRRRWHLTTLCLPMRDTCPRPSLAARVSRS
jgi:hypothetical protein